MKEDWTQKEGWLKEENLIYVGLIGIGVVAAFWHPFGWQEWWFRSAGS